ncbi:IS630 family transposase [Rubinisphaera brasiliensis]|uniref:Transposase n=1 Tax=Rubinisphaera brasiliensis (strain ATCC 49424 / DSM 5305 / JCM 21570 / IAM 15109 / NBRC 103401 / IFAM 1448) TaxID=756272 RepID=F0SHT1_RUBBR|nr:transposase [Rubinisphaera brasiliensis DSM 5305]
MASEQHRPVVARRRATWKIRQPGLNPERLVFFDETWAKTNMTRPRGRVFNGKRLIAHTPHGHWKTTTFLAGLRTTGLVAPLVVDGAINGDMFVAYVKQQLTKALRPGDIVILDNLSSHERDETRQAIEAAGAELRFLPPYSPDLNPIEQAFSKLKWLLRSAKKRTVVSLWETCGQLTDRFGETESRNFICHA